VTLGRIGRHEYVDDGARPVEGLGNRLPALDEEPLFAGPLLLPEQPTSRSQQPQTGRGRCDRLVIVRQREPQAAVPVAGSLAATASAAGTCSLANSTSAAKAAESLTASSARILRSTSTPAAFRPEMKRL